MATAIRAQSKTQIDNEKTYSILALQMKLIRISRNLTRRDYHKLFHALLSTTYVPMTF